MIDSLVKKDEIKSKDGEHVFIIAEIGVNHNGNVLTAMKLIDEAKSAGADAVKFQSYNPENTKIRNAPFADYQKSDLYKSSFEMSKKLMLSEENHLLLKKYCDDLGICFLSTGFDYANIDLLDRIGVPYHKIPSGEIDNYPLLEYVAKKNKPIILSTGMADLSEIDEAVRFIRKFNDHHLVILHCVSLYPAGFSYMNLNFINTLKAAFDATIGFSDHTTGYEADIAAVTLGARVIEKHITLDKNQSGPDHMASLIPCELREMVKAIRNIEIALGTGVKIVGDEEIKMRKIARRSIVTGSEIKKGDRFNMINLLIKRPGDGIPSRFLEQIIGRVATQDIANDIQLTWDVIGGKPDVV